MRWARTLNPPSMGLVKLRMDIDCEANNGYELSRSMVEVVIPVKLRLGSRSRQQEGHKTITWCDNGSRG